MILSTKLHVPHTHSTLLQRPALMRSLDEGLKYKLTVVSAPAGYGKTTAISEWVRLNEVPCAWISLDKLDNDVMRFWSHVIAAIERWKPGFGTRLWPDRFASHSAASLESAVTALLNELVGLSDELVIVLDDFHLIELASLHAMISYMLEHLPPHIHLYLTSRTAWPLPLARLRAKGQLHTIQVQELRFQPEEGILYFRDCMKLSLPEHDAALLVRQTEGWIGGMHLAALSLRSNGDRSGFIRQFSGRQREISHYLLEEVFQQQSDEVRDFLLATSILNRMNGSLCEAVTGLTDGQARLELLEQLNLFIVPLDEQREWYRYHDLFADFLRRQLRERHADRWTQAHADAARWLEQHGLLVEAVEQLLTGNLHAAAASLIECRLSDIRLPYATLLRWLSALPESSLAEKPTLQLLHVKALIETEEWPLAESKLQSIEAVLSGPGREPWLSALYLMRAELSFYRKDLNQAAEYLDYFERHMPEGSILQTMMRNAANGGGFDRLLASVNDLRAAGRLIQKLISVWERKADYPFVGYFYVAYGKLLYEWNRLEEAEQCFARVLRQKPMPAYERMMTDASIGAARISRARDDLERAFELIEQAQQQLCGPDKLSFHRKLDAEKVRLSMLQGTVAEASAWLQSCGLKSSDSIPPQRAEEYLDLARALAACGHASEASQLLTRIYRLAVQEDRHYFQIKALILQSILLQDEEDMPAAIIKLETALQLAEPQGYVRSFADEGENLAKLLALYLDLRQRSFIRSSAPISLPYVKKLLQLMQAGKEEPTVLFPLTEQETKILRLIEQGLSNKEIAARTGVSVGTVKTHIKNLYRKLEVNNRLQAIQRGRMLNML